MVLPKSYFLEGGNGEAYPSFEIAQRAQIRLANQGIETGAIVTNEDEELDHKELLYDLKDV